jgi:hypothetical protein
LLLIPRPEDRLERLVAKLKLAEAATPDLIAEIISESCNRLLSQNRAGSDRQRFGRLMQLSAWTDLALLLISLELPQCSLRRLVQEDGVWHCSLSEQVAMPLALDDTADAVHENLPLAILSAFVEACCMSAVGPAEAREVPRVSVHLGVAACCDNFR